MKILVTGAKGMLGKDLSSILKKSNHEVLETDIEELDITQIDKVYEIVKTLKPEIILNFAAYTQVDKAEQEPEKAFLINGAGTQNLALICRDFNIDLLHISTDYIFDGEKKSPYTPFDSPNPINVYGLSKLAGEKYLQWLWDKFYIIRTSWLYGKNGPNFVFSILKLAQTRKEIKVVNDQIGSPTWTVTLSQAISEIIETKKYGIYHISDYTDHGISWFAFAQEIINLSGSKAKIIPFKTEEFPQLARRPSNSVLDLTMTRLIFKINIPTWKESLRNFLSQIKEPT